MFKPLYRICDSLKFKEIISSFIYKLTMKRRTKFVYLDLVELADQDELWMKLA